MNVWIINHYAIPPRLAGGTRHFHLAKELIATGDQALIVAANFAYMTREEHAREDVAPVEDATTDRDGRSSRVEDVDGVPFLWLRVPKYRGNSFARVWNMAVFAARVALVRTKKLPRPDVVVGSMPHPFAALAAERLARRLGVPFVLEVRDLWPQSLIDLGDFRPGHPFIRVLSWIERYLYRRATRIVSLLPGALDYIAEKGAERERIAWIPNGVDLGGDTSPPPPPNANGRKFSLLYAGSHGLANGLHTVLDAAAILKRTGSRGPGQGHRQGRGAGPAPPPSVEEYPDRIEFRLLGDGPEKPRLQERAQTEGLDNVRFDDAVAKDAVGDRLRQADALVILLKDSPVFRWGISPNKLFDYMAAARPVIFGIRSPFNPIETASAGLTVPPEDADALAKAALDLYRASPEERRDMGLRGRRYVEEHHNFVRLGAQLREVLADACDGGR